MLRVRSAKQFCRPWCPEQRPPTGSIQRLQFTNGRQAGQIGNDILRRSWQSVATSLHLFFGPCQPTACKHRVIYAGGGAVACNAHRMPGLHRITNWDQRHAQPDPKFPPRPHLNGGQRGGDLVPRARPNGKPRPIPAKNEGKGFWGKCVDHCRNHSGTNHVDRFVASGGNFRCGIDNIGNANQQSRRRFVVGISEIKALYGARSSSGSLVPVSANAWFVY